MTTRTAISETSRMALCKRLATVILSTMTAAVMAATGSTRVIPSGGGAYTDYASLSAAMLRSMGIPTKLVTGYVGADELYHAWIMVYIDGTWQEAQFTVSPNEWSRCDVTFASTGATKYVGDASAYIDRYIY